MFFLRFWRKHCFYFLSQSHPWRNNIDSNIVLSDFHCQITCESEHGSLGCRVAMSIRGWLMNADSVDADDTTPAPSFHSGQHGLRTKKSGFQSGIKLFLPLGPCSFLKTFVWNRSSIVADQDIYLAEGVFDFS